MNTGINNCPKHELKEAYVSIVGRVCHDTALVMDKWAAVEQAYADERRHYHNLVHLQHFYRQLLACRKELSDFETAFLAMVYHDVVYFSPEGKDEEESAKIAQNHLAELGFPQEVSVRCQEMIVATKTHVESEDQDTNYFIDADMSILGEGEHTYYEYAANIRKEYGASPQFNRGRARVLEYFLDMERIYKTKWFFDRYEIQARANIRRELERLKKQIGE